MYFCPILASILAKGFATYLFLSSELPIVPGLRTLPLKAFWTIYISSSSPPTNYFKAIIELWSNISIFYKGLNTANII